MSASKSPIKLPRSTSGQLSLSSSSKFSSFDRFLDLVFNECESFEFEVEFASCLFVVLLGAADAARDKGGGIEDADAAVGRLIEAPFNIGKKSVDVTSTDLFLPRFISQN